MASGRLAGAEALARWSHAERGLLEPWQFMCAIEEGGLTLTLVETVLDNALAERSRWRATGLAAAVSVNLSLRSAGDPSLAERLAAITSRYGVDPRHVVLEVAQPAEAALLAGALDNLSRLRVRGFGLAIDNYGTGPSLAGQLALMPFTELKIDRTLVRNTAHAAGRALLESKVSIARRLGLRTVAVGVETRSEWELLATLGCDLAQGHYLATPMPSAEFVSWARRLPRRPPP
jgi:EAL domain-containing protein (putative c-di-GMP-specific phosphodiesterase class I)